MDRVYVQLQAPIDVPHFLLSDRTGSSRSSRARAGASPASTARAWCRTRGRLLRACLANLDRWVTEGEAPPSSRHPRLADGTAVDPDDLAKTFDRLPAARYPRHHPRPQRQDWSTLPPRRGPAYGTRVSAVDEIGRAHV